MADRWLDLAPKPDALPAGKEWHVFLSYRSVNRPWVLALYDVLNVLGYKVFLDQYVLTAAAPLAIALGDALDASAGAVMIWSGSYEDSEWCKQEFAKLETMQSLKKGFRYVIARIDESEVAGLAATKLWIDFSKQREGPAGSGMLSLLYGLKGQPLPPAAVKLAAEVDAQMRDGLLSVKAARDAGDADALVALAETDDMTWTGSPMLMCSVAEGLIAMNKTPEAIKVLDRVEAAFPKALRPKQLRGLALARSGQTMQAQLLLGKLYAAGEIDPETLGILARTWMDRYNQSGDQLFLLKSRDLYRQAFEAFTGGAFPRKFGGENRTVTVGRRLWWPRMAGLQPLSTRAFGPRLRRLTALTALATRPLIATKRSTARCGQSVCKCHAEKFRSAIFARILTAVHTRRSVL